MTGSDPSIELPSSDLLDDDAVGPERASLLYAAQSAPNIAMLTGTYGVVVPPLTRPDAKLPDPRAVAPEGAFEPRDGEGPVVALLRARVLSVDASADPVGAVRARLELTRALRDEGDREGAAAALEEATRAATAPMYAIERERRLELAGRERLEEQLACVSTLAATATDPRVRADHLAERGRLVVAQSGAWEEAEVAHREAVALSPDHAAASYGYEVAVDMAGRWRELEAHLGQLADRAAASGAHSNAAAAAASAAWLHVERAQLLDDREKDAAGARNALHRALELAGGKGPVRDACVDHAAKHRDDAWLAELLEGEAALETEPARAARLELDAALAHERAGADHARATRLLERALSRAPTVPFVDHRVATELARLLDAQHRFDDALRVRKLALRQSSDPRAELVLLRAIATCAERGGELDEAVLALERARVLEADDPTLLADLDRILTAAQRHEQRAVAWVREAALVDEPERKARALVEAARASRAAGREEDARKHLQTAWITAPGARGVYDALAGELAPAGSRELVAARVALYEQAVRGTRDPDKRVHWLEKIAWLWDDVAGDAVLATRAYEDVLAIEPGRPSAIAGLASSATRAGDDRALARALLAEADVTADSAARAHVRLRAAEVLASVDRERSLALASELAADERVGARARALVTRLHSEAGRWEQVVTSLAERGERAKSTEERVALALAEADVALGRLASPDRAVAALVRARAVAADDPALVNATLEALEVLGDPDRVREELGALAGAAREPSRRAALFLRLAELEEARGEDEKALEAYGRALEALPGEPLVVDRIIRLGARARDAVDAVHPEIVPPVRRARRELEVTRRTSAETLLASPDPDFAALRLAERIARRARAAPQLANALALQVEVAPPMLAMRALAGVAELVAWTLPPADDVEPWDRLVERGSDDVTFVDELVRRAWPRLDHEGSRLLTLVGRALERRTARALGDTEQLLLLLDVATVNRKRSDLRAAELACITALGLEPASATAAAWLAQLAAETRNASAAILAATSFANLCRDARAAAKFLSDASDLELARGESTAAASLLERALAADPDNVLTAARLAEVQAKRGAWTELGRVLRTALAAARSPDAIVPMASELAQVARERLKDPHLAIEALERAREVAPSHTPSRFLLAELYIGQRVWERALSALGEIVERSTEKSERLVALTGRAAVLARGLGRPEAAEADLRAALELESHDPRALRLLLDTAKGRMAGEERAALLSRLALSEPVPERRRVTLLELADARRAIGDSDGMEGALIEAAALAPEPAMLDRIRELTRDDQGAFARVVSRAIARARESGQATSPAWLARLGQIEADVLGKHDEAIEHLRDALEADPKRLELRPLLVRVLVSTGRNPEAAAEAMPLFGSPAGASHVDGLTLRLLEAALAGSGRPAEARVARELRALAGTMDARERATLDTARGTLPSEPDALSSSTLRALMPTLGRHPLWDVAQISLGLAGKLARVGLSELGASARDRVKPRTPHPLRAPFERALRVFGLTEVELAVSEGAPRPGVAVEDVPWVVLPAALADTNDATLDAALVRPLTLIALGVPAADALSAADVLGAIVAFGRQGAPSFGSGTSGPVEAAAEASELRARRAIDRRRKRMLEDMRDTLESAPPVSDTAFAEELARLLARVVLLVTGDFRAALGALSGAQPAGLEVLRAPHPNAIPMLVGSALPRDLLAFALGGEAARQRQRLGISS